MQDLNSTMTANKIGTPQWSPPEVLRGDPYSRQADVYAMGIILHELYSGIHPYPTTQANHVAYRVAFGLLTVHFGDGGTSPDSDEGAPPVFVALARACLAPELEERPLFPEVLDRIMVRDPPWLLCCVSRPCFPFFIIIIIILFLLYF